MQCFNGLNWRRRYGRAFFGNAGGTRDGAGEGGKAVAQEGKYVKQIVNRINNRG